METIYNKYAMTNEAGGQFSIEASQAIEPLLEKYAKMGYNPRELLSCLVQLASVKVAELCIKHAVKLKKEERENGYR